MEDKYFDGKVVCYAGKLFTCICPKCGMAFAFPKQFKDARLKDTERVNNEC